MLRAGRASCSSSSSLKTVTPGCGSWASAWRCSGLTAAAAAGQCSSSAMAWVIRLPRPARAPKAPWARAGAVAVSRAVAVSGALPSGRLSHCPSRAAEKPMACATRSRSSSRYTPGVIFSSSGRARATKRALPSAWLTSASVLRCAIRYSDRGSAPRKRASKASPPSLPTSESGSSPSGRNRKRISRPSRASGSALCKARQAAARPARSPSKQNTSSLTRRKARRRCSGVVAVPSVATA